MRANATDTRAGSATGQPRTGTLRVGLIHATAGGEPTGVDDATYGLGARAAWTGAHRSRTSDCAPIINRRPAAAPAA